ncbi:DUF4232 domain-containing protein [Kitasatospora sp. NPDC054939]
MTGAGGGAPPRPSGVPTAGPGTVSAQPLPGTTFDPSPTPTPTAPPPTCSPAGMLLRTEEPNAAMGLRATTVRLTNCGTEPLTLDGYPAVRVLDGEHRPLDIAVGRGTSGITVLPSFDPGVKRFTLKPGATARFGLVWRNTVAASDKVPDDGRYLEITPATGAARHEVPLWLDLGTTGKLGVSAWEPDPTTG